ncbi:hypothetical protein LOZ58_000283 [Ophidiomyces ophidiicola]|nr:hypothetical protein LOZ66_003874 [Ophidiomyces ophidiicola]KAI1966794.1 hypothetical protein LOZ58_000283 [Ophidiomyces ophidiicola]
MSVVGPALAFLHETLSSLELVLWGEVALAQLGAPTTVNSIMIIPTAGQFDLAARMLVDAGCRTAPWSYGTLDPRLIEACNNPAIQRIHASVAQQYYMLDLNSLRFEFSSPELRALKLLLIRAHYVDLAPPKHLGDIAGGQFTRVRNFYYPGKLVLLKSFIAALLNNKAAAATATTWDIILETWAVSYLCGYLDVGVDAFDSCPDNSIKDWYNHAIRRDRGGLDRSITKRTGRLG